MPRRPSTLDALMLELSAKTGCRWEAVRVTYRMGVAYKFSILAPGSMSPTLFPLGNYAPRLREATIWAASLCDMVNMQFIPVKDLRT